MGACCSCQRGRKFEDFIDEEEENEFEDMDGIGNGDFGARVRLQGSSKLVSMFTQQGKKGINQDAMTVWENFAGEKDMIFCGIFDGHGPSGHNVAHFIRDFLPSKLSSTFMMEERDDSNNVDDHTNNENIESTDGDDDEIVPFFTAWKANILKSFKEIDEELEGDSKIDSYCSGTTAVTVLKQGKHLIIANLGDSRAILCSRNNGQFVPIQLTVDMKPDLPNECARIKCSKGRVLEMEEEPNVFRIWMPNDDCPGLAMARAFGDFCLKDCGLISTPEISYRKLTDTDEFLVIATDGVWDVLTNNEVVSIVASAKKRSMAARLLVDRAVRSWRYQYPCAKIDDCAVICLFFKRQRPSLTKSISKVTKINQNYTEIGLHGSAKTNDDLETVLNCEVTKDS